MRQLQGGGRRRDEAGLAWTGPEFDGHQVNYELLMDRLNAFREQEKESQQLFEDEEMQKCRMKEELDRMEFE